MEASAARKIMVEFKELFSEYEPPRTSDIESHIVKLKELDKILPECHSFLFIVNPVERKYHYFTANFEKLTGWKKKEILSQGIAFMLERIHSEDTEAWTGGFQKVLNSTKDFSGNRLKTCSIYHQGVAGNGKYFTMLINQVPIAISDKGLPIYP